jgi:hypothetical protein
MIIGSIDTVIAEDELDEELKTILEKKRKKE